MVTAPALPDIGSGLTAAAKSYNNAVAAMSKPGAESGKAKAEISAAQGQIEALCKSSKFASTAQCLAQYAIRLAPIPAAAGIQPVVGTPVQPVEVITTLPKGLTQQDVAPLLDSAKDKKTGATPAQPAAPQATPAPQGAARGYAAAKKRQGGSGRS